jgi:kynureninase
MPPTFSPIPGAQGFQQSNPHVLAVASLLGSLQIFKEAGMLARLRPLSLKLTGHLEARLKASKHFVPVEESIHADKKFGFTIITPADPEARGAQLSLVFLPIGSGAMMKVFDGLKSYGVIGDERKPDVIRLAPAPLFNTKQDCDQAADALEKVLDALA